MKHLSDIIETYQSLLSCRKNLPGMSMEEAFSAAAVSAIEEELEWLKGRRGQRTPPLTEADKRAEILKKCGLVPQAFCPSCWSATKKILARTVLAEDANCNANALIGAQADETDDIVQLLIAVGVKLKKALDHAERRLNEIPHNYEETDFKLIREAKQAAEEFRVDEQHTGESTGPTEQGRVD